MEGRGFRPCSHSDCSPTRDSHERLPHPGVFPDSKRLLHVSTAFPPAEPVPLSPPPGSPVRSHQKGRSLWHSSVQSLCLRTYVFLLSCSLKLLLRSWAGSSPPCWAENFSPTQPSNALGRGYFWPWDIWEQERTLTERGNRSFWNSSLKQRMPASLTTWDDKLCSSMLEKLPCAHK